MLYLQAVMPGGLPINGWYALQCYSKCAVNAEAIFSIFLLVYQTSGLCWLGIERKAVFFFFLIGGEKALGLKWVYYVCTGVPIELYMIKYAQKKLML